jgi:hypothetical protein
MLSIRDLLPRKTTAPVMTDMIRASQRQLTARLAELRAEHQRLGLATVEGDRAAAERRSHVETEIRAGERELALLADWLPAAEQQAVEARARERANVLADLTAEASRVLASADDHVHRLVSRLFTDAEIRAVVADGRQASTLASVLHALTGDVRFRRPIDVRHRLRVAFEEQLRLLDRTCAPTTRAPVDLAPWRGQLDQVRALDAQQKGDHV